MKKLLFGLIATVFFGLGANAQDFTTENETSIVYSRELKSEFNSITNEVVITNKSTKKVLPSFIYKFTLNEKKDIKSLIKENPNELSGTLVLTVDSEKLLVITIEKGKLTSKTSYNYTGKKHPCTISGQFACIDDKLEAMNWVEYGACLITAPECYAMLHASCAWDNCH